MSRYRGDGSLRDELPTYFRSRAHIGAVVRASLGLRNMRVTSGPFDVNTEGPLGGGPAVTEDTVVVERTLGVPDA